MSMTIKQISGSPYDTSAVIKNLNYIHIPCTITSFGDFENNFALFNIDFLDNEIEVETFKAIAERFRKMAFNHEIEPIYIRATNGEKETVIGVYGYKDVDYEGLC